MTAAACRSVLQAGSTDPEKIAVMSGGNPPTLVGMFGSEIAITGTVPALVVVLQSVLQERPTQLCTDP